jgi:adenosylcobinamide-phosphate synthase
MFYFALFGVPGALFYRVVNTYDSMIGYHGRYEYLGKVAARLDDLLNIIPARLTGLLLVAASRLRRAAAGGAWRVMLRDHAVTESPNAGWPMSAMAGALGVRLEKVGHYRLGDAEVEPSAGSIARATAVASTALALAAVLTLLIVMVRNAYFA